MATAVQTAEPTTYLGEARTFRIEPTLHDQLTGIDHTHITVCLVTLGGPRVEVFGTREDGSPYRMNPLPGSYVLHHVVSLDDACTLALALAGGYVVTDTVPEAE